MLNLLPCPPLDGGHLLSLAVGGAAATAGEVHFRRRERPGSTHLARLCLRDDLATLDQHRVRGSHCGVPSGHRGHRGLQIRRKLSDFQEGAARVGE